MKQSLAVGISSVASVAVDDGRTIAFLGEEGRVYATPWLVRDIEHTCRDLLLAHADAGEDSVGTEVAIRHLAPALPGSVIEIAVTVTALDGRKVAFAVTARDEFETISTGTHSRFVVDTKRTIERLKEKRAKLPPR